MARITDQSRIERLKQSTMKLVIENGFGGASAVLIARDANVAAGYFYMFYKGKYEMVNSLLQDVYQEIIRKLEELFENGSSFNKIVENLINFFFNLANIEPMKIKFIYVLSNDNSFVIDPEVRNNTFLFIKRVKELGYSAGMLDKKITEEDLYLFLVVNTIQFINQRFKNFPESGLFTQDDEDHLLYLIHKILN